LQFKQQLNLLFSFVQNPFKEEDHKANTVKDSGAQHDGRPC
jgi:hypothetical protein